MWLGLIMIKRGFASSGSYVYQNCKCKEWRPFQIFVPMKYDFYSLAVVIVCDGCNSARLEA
jgi:hypothetical protein